MGQAPCYGACHRDAANGQDGCDRDCEQAARVSKAKARSNEPEPEIAEDLTRLALKEHTTLSVVAGIPVANRHGEVTGVDKVGSTVDGFGTETPPGGKPDLRRNLTRQAAGHGGANILKDFTNVSDSGIPEYIFKAWDEVEANNYRLLQSQKDPLVRFLAHFAGEVEERQGKVGQPLEKYMRLSNLLRRFQRGPHVMDCKIGTRSFTENEVECGAQRPDLYKRLLDIAPHEVTPEEKESGAITKHRWMSFNDHFTSLATLGFRIDGIDGIVQITKKDLKSVREIDQAVECIMTHFLPIPITTVREEEEGEDDDDMEKGMGTTFDAIRVDVADMILQELKDMRQVMGQSSFIQTHELVGASLLFVADAHGPSAGVFLIDFAKTQPLPTGVIIDHVSQWAPGNHEDGVLLGVDNLIKIWTQVYDRVKKDVAEHEQQRGIPRTSRMAKMVCCRRRKKPGA